MALIEIAADALDSALAAEQGGAQRVELCSALREGGLTPSLGLLRRVRARVSLELLVLLRPRAGDFLYTDEEMEVLREDLKIARQEGADGVVLGFLTPEGEVDEPRTADLILAARPMKVTFHRAIDMARDRGAALQAAMRCGADRILTSGGAPSAMEGSESLRQLVQLAGSEIEVVVGGGVRPQNLAEIATRTGASQFHSSLAHTQASGMRFRQAGVSMGARGEEEYTRNVVRVEDVRALVRAAEAAMQVTTRLTKRG